MITLSVKNHTQKILEIDGYNYNLTIDEFLTVLDKAHKLEEKGLLQILELVPSDFSIELIPLPVEGIYLDLNFTGLTYTDKNKQH